MRPQNMVRGGVFVLALLGAASAVMSGEVEGLDKRMSLNLAGAPARQVFESFGSILGLEVRLSSGVKGDVVIRVRNVTVKTTLDALCESLGCTWQAIPEALIVSAGERIPDGEMRDKPVTVRFDDVPSYHGFRWFAEMGGWRLDYLCGEPISLELDAVTLWQAMDEACTAAGCAWEVDESAAPPVLRVRF